MYSTNKYLEIKTEKTKKKILKLYVFSINIICKCVWLDKGMVGLRCTISVFATNPKLPFVKRKMYDIKYFQEKLIHFVISLVWAYKGGYFFLCRIRNLAYLLTWCLWNTYIYLHINIYLSLCTGYTFIFSFTSNPKLGLLTLADGSIASPRLHKMALFNTHNSIVIPSTLPTSVPIVRFLSQLITHIKIF